MGCPNSAILGQDLTFTIQSFDTNGEPVDTDALPTYKVYEMTTDTEILSGDMAKLADASTTGFYAKTISITTANGFELWKSYAVRIVAAVAGTAVAEVYSFIVASSAVAVTATTGALTTLANVKTYCGIIDSDNDDLLNSLIDRATAAIETYCRRTLRSTTWRERRDGNNKAILGLWQYPVTALEYVSFDTIEAVKLLNTSSDAWNASASIDGTYLTLTVSGGTNDGNDVLTLASYTLTGLVAAINALGKGWSAELSESDYGYWDAAELLPVMGLRCFDDDYAYLLCPEEPESEFDIDTESGLLYSQNGFTLGRQNITIRYTAGYATIPADLEQIAIDLVALWYRAKDQQGNIESERLADHSVSYDIEHRLLPRDIQIRLGAYRRPLVWG